MRQLMHTLFDNKTSADKAAEIGQAPPTARSLRLTNITSRISGTSDASYKCIQPLLHDSAPRQALWRLFQEPATFMIGDVTEIKRSQTRHTAYLGNLSNGKISGFWALVLAAPH